MPSPRRLFSDSLLLLPVLLAVGLGTLLVSGWYRSLTRTTGSHSFYSLLPRTSFIVLLLLLFSTLDRSLGPATFVLVLALEPDDCRFGLKPSGGKRFAASPAALVIAGVHRHSHLDLWSRRGWLPFAPRAAA